MLKTVEGIYRDGRVELTNLPENVGDRSSVLITFLDAGMVDPVQLRRLIDQLETIAGIQQGLDEVNAGKTRPIEDFVHLMQQKYDISG